MLFRRSRIFFAINILFFASSPVFAATLTIQRIEKDNILVSKTGEKLELADIVIPGFYQSMVQKTLTRTLAGKVVTVTEAYPNRYGKIYVHLMDASGKNIQAWLLGKGMAYHYIMHPLTPEQTEEWIMQEAQARKKQKGLWKYAPFKVKEIVTLNESDLLQTVDIHFLSGMVTSVEYHKGQYFFHLAYKPAADFIAMIPQTAVSENPDIFAKKWAGRSVLLRGWLESYHGPYMKLYHSSHIMPALSK